MTIRDRINHYYYDCNFNCAETVLHCANDEWNLGLSDECFKVIGCFGGGCGCGSFCGALAGAEGALGAMIINPDAHATPGAVDKFAELLSRFKEKMPSELCKDISPIYKKPETRCVEPIICALEVLAELKEKYGI